MRPVWEIRQHATGPSLKIQVRDEATGLPFALTGAVAVAHAHNPATGLPLFTDHACVIEDAPEGIVRLDWDAADTAIAGTMLLEFEITLASGSVETYPQAEYISLVIRTDLNGS